MADVFTYIFNLKLKQDQILSQLNGVKEGVDKVNKSVVNLGDRFKSHLSNLNISSIIEQTRAVADGMNQLSEPGLKFSTSLSEMSALTGLTGKKLDGLSNSAREISKEFGISAANSVESFKTVLSKLGPDLANSPKSLGEMGKSIATLSKQMGGDATAAADVLTTAMNQYQVSTEDPAMASKTMASMMNVMSAAAKEGSAQLPSIKEALEQAGLAAKVAGVSFEETNAAIQVLDAGGKIGSEGGVALRNVMSTLSQGRFLPKDVQEELAKAGIDVAKLTDKSLSLSERLTPLKGLLNDSALMTKLFGEENSSAATVLISNIDQVDSMANAITGTKDAYEQAAVIMDSPAEKAAKLQQQVEDFKITIFNASGGLMSYAGVLGNVGMNIANLIPLYNVFKGTVMGAISVVNWLRKAENLSKIARVASAVVTGTLTGVTWLWTAAQWALNAAMWANPITWVVAAVIALIAVIVYLIYKIDGWGAAWKHTVAGAKLSFQAFIENIKFSWNTLVNSLMIGINKIKEGWYKFKNAVGIGDESENNKMLASIKADTDRRANEIVNGAKRIAKLQMKSNMDFYKAATSLKWNNKSLSDVVGDLQQEVGIKKGIADPKTPGVNPVSPKVKSTPKQSTNAKLNESIATGGQKNTTINITFKNMVEGLTITGKDFKESAQNMNQELQDQFFRMLAMAQTTAG